MLRNEDRLTLRLVLKLDKKLNAALTKNRPFFISTLRLFRSSLCFDFRCIFTRVSYAKRVLTIADASVCVCVS